jgi:isopentenyl diphosphate isomerase/L-lactate dehydrogenase-like FMN-dependent dehydrogenase
VLVDVSTVDTSCVLPSIGVSTGTPIMVAPVAMQKLAHPDGECAAARAASAAGTVYTISQQATTSIENIAEGGGGGPKLFQLYVLRDREIVGRLLRKAEAAGCSAIAVTVDSPVLGRRERDIRNRFRLKAGMQLANFVKPKATSGGGGKVNPAQAKIAKRIGNRDPGLTWQVTARPPHHSFRVFLVAARRQFLGVHMCLWTICNRCLATPSLTND